MTVARQAGREGLAMRRKREREEEDTYTQLRGVVITTREGIGGVRDGEFLGVKKGMIEMMRFI